MALSVVRKVAASHEVREYPMYIDGRWTPAEGGKVQDDFNPATGELFARIAYGSQADVRRAIDAATRAKAGWANMLVGERANLLLRVADLIVAKADSIRDVIIAESGSVFGKASFEVGYCIDLLRSAAGDARHICGDTLPQSMAGQVGFTLRQPLGVVVGIAPFNAPFLLAMKKVALALAAGNTFVLKPSDETPVTGLLIAELFHEAGLPPGVLNVVTGPAQEIGQVLLTDPRVRMITFTGSTRVGKYLAVEAAKGLKRITLELGGKNPMVVLRDADIDYAAHAACFGIFFHQGQVCMASSRLIIEEPVYEAFCDAFVRRASTYKVGDPRDPTTVIGPLIRPTQCDVINGHVEDAVAKGAQADTRDMLPREIAQHATQEMFWRDLVFAIGCNQQAVCALNAAADELQEIERRLVRPVQVLENYDADWIRRRKSFQKPRK